MFSTHEIQVLMNEIVEYHMEIPTHAALGFILRKYSVLTIGLKLASYKLMQESF